MKVKEDLVVVVDDLGKIGSKPKVIEDVLQCGDEGGTSFRVRDVGYDPPHGPGTGGVSEYGSQRDYRESDLAYSGRKLVVTNF